MRAKYLLGLVSCISFTNAKTCVMPKNSTTGGDDTPSILSASTFCLSNSTILFSSGLTYNLLTPLSLTNLNNVKLSFEGNVSLPRNVSQVEAVVKNTKIYPGHWITIKGKDVTFSGSTCDDGGWFEGEFSSSHFHLESFS